MKIFLIDDDEAAHIYHKIMIEEAGINVESVASHYDVDQAIQSLKDLSHHDDSVNWPDYIFVDLNMPRKSGYDFITEYENIHPKFDKTQIYFVSSTLNPRDLEKVKLLKLVKGFESKFLQADFFKRLVSDKQLAS